MSKNIPEHISHRYLALELHATKAETYAQLAEYERRAVGRLKRAEEKIKSVIMGTLIGVGIVMVLVLSLTAMSVSDANNVNRSAPMTYTAT